jgi:hypothetical protein
VCAIPKKQRKLQRDFEEVLMVRPAVVLFMSVCAMQLSKFMHFSSRRDRCCPRAARFFVGGAIFGFTLAFPRQIAGEQRNPVMRSLGKRVL